ncbi:UDP-3-O-(3-hydroxymyristoyl)glucosamine N-acyltransferase [bacterium]|nr:UDP-3-O-(3-hydroxymyristoyl)glucosamine N-acyltransferase [bacterium]
MKKISFTLDELSKHLSVPLLGDKDVMITGVNDISKASSSEASFFANDKYTSKLKKSQAGVICIDESAEQMEGQNYLLCKDPSEAFEKLCLLFLEDHSKSGFTDIHPSAVIHPTATIGKDVTIGPFVAIDKEVVIGDGTTIYAHASIGPKSILGSDCIIHPNTTVREDCHLGDRVILQPGAVIGSCGYGYHTDKTTGRHTKIKHLGKVILEDDVEIGANTTVDRGRFATTTIKRGTKIDNLCMIAHNCEIGEDNLIVSMSGISGSVKTGRNVIVAAQCGLIGHIEIGDGVILAARATPIKSIKEKGVYLGSPAQPIKKEMVQTAAVRKLPTILRKLKKAEKMLDSFESMQEQS